MRNSDWEHALEKSPLNGKEKQQHRVIIRWFLGYCRKRQPSALPGRHLANEFDRKVLRGRNPPDWQLSQWRDGLRWFLQFLGEEARPSTEQADPEPSRDAPLGEPTQGVAAKAPGLETGDPADQESPKEEQGKPTGAPGGNAAWRLTMIGQVRLKHLSYRTEQTYLEWVSRFAGFLKGRNPLTATDEDVVDFLSDLAVRKQVAGATQNQAFNALLFFFRHVLGRTDVRWTGVERAQGKARQPTVLTPEELSRLFGQLEGTRRLMARLLYGAGMRLMELIRLRVQHLDFARGVVVVRAGKGDKDRETTLPATLGEELKAHLARVKGLFEQDLAEKVPGVWLPESLARKYPQAGRQWIWQWVFPSRQLSRDPRSGVLRRHHVQENAFQKALADAGRRAGLDKRVTPHTLRHCFASHLLDNGSDIRTVQALMGHSSVETTQIYLHVMRKPGLGVRSPLDQ